MCSASQHQCVYYNNRSNTSVWLISSLISFPTIFSSVNYIASEWKGICFSFIHLISFASGSHVTGVIHAVKEMCLRCFNKNMHVWGQSLYIRCELMLLYDILLCGCSILTVDNAAKCAPNCGWPAVVVTVMPQICPFHLMQYLHRHLFPLFCAPPRRRVLQPENIWSGGILMSYGVQFLLEDCFW